MISIRRAEVRDIDWLLIQLKQFAEFLKTKHSVYGDEQYARSGLQVLIEKHVFLIAEKNGDPIGFISGFFTPHLFNPNLKILCELFWFVIPEFRRSRAGSMLLNEYMRFGKENAQWITMALNRFTQVNEQSLLKRGFQLHEKTYLFEN